MLPILAKIHLGNCDDKQRKLSAVFASQYRNLVSNFMQIHFTLKESTLPWNNSQGEHQKLSSFSQPQQVTVSSENENVHKVKLFMNFCCHITKQTKTLLQPRTRSCLNYFPYLKFYREKFFRLSLAHVIFLHLSLSLALSLLQKLSPFHGF